ncbi:hypothetical protein [Rhizobium etli]|nr:hypothetical protein [Rhizobium etli]
MQNISRRLFLSQSSAAAVSGLAASTTIAQPVVTDPLIDAIAAYRSGLADFNQNAPEDDMGSNAYGEITWKPAHAVLASWTRPAISREGALEALRIAHWELDYSGDSAMIVPMMAAALSYFEKEDRT